MSIFFNPAHFRPRIEKPPGPKRIHPLTNEVILQVFVKYIRQCDIPKCRLVCQQWNKHLIPRMRSEFLVKCWDQKNYSRLSARFAKFVAIMEASEEIPYGHFRLVNLIMTDPMVEKFFEVCGPHIHTLQVQFKPGDIDICSLRELLIQRAPSMVNFCVEGVGIPESVTSRSILFPNWAVFQANGEEGPNLPNLEAIEFKADDGQKCHPGFLYDLFKAATNLKTLIYLKFTDYSYSTKILFALNQAENFVNLKELHMERLNEEAVALLIEMGQHGLALKEFSFQSLKDDVQGHSLEAFIDSQKESLEILTLNEVMGNRKLSIRLPEMQKLKKLTRSAICSSHIVFGPICYARSLPSLEELSVYAFADELDWNDYFSQTVNGLECTTLKKLELPINMKDPNKLKQLKNIFPNVTSLIVTYPSDEIIPLLWELWPGLEELNMSLTDRNSNVDSLFTGIPNKECNSILSHKSFGAVDIERIRTGKSISDLRGLKTLNLEISPKDIFGSYCFHTSSCLPTNITGYFGLAYLHNIQELTISHSKITMECGVYFESKFHRITRVRVCDSDGRPVVSSTLFCW